MILLVAVGCDTEPEADPSAECSIEDDFVGCDAQQLEEALDGLGGKEDGWFTYESGYTNIVLVGQTTAGLDVVAIVGTHSADYPLCRVGCVGQRAAYGGRSTAAAYRCRHRRATYRGLR